MSRNYLEEQYKSDWYRERSARWYDEYNDGKPIKRIAVDNLVCIQTVYRCIRRVEKHKLMEAGNGGLEHQELLP